MSPFSHYLYELRNSRRISQLAIAELMGYAQGYISSLELGKKLPNDEFLNKLIQILNLNLSEAEALRKSAKESQRRYVLAQNADLEQYKLVHDLWNKLDLLHPAQLRAIKEVLNFPYSQELRGISEADNNQLKRKGERPM